MQMAASALTTLLMVLWGAQPLWPSPLYLQCLCTNPSVEKRTRGLSHSSRVTYSQTDSLETKQKDWFTGFSEMEISKSLTVGTNNHLRELPSKWPSTTSRNFSIFFTFSSSLPKGRVTSQRPQLACTLAHLPSRQGPGASPGALPSTLDKHHAPNSRENLVPVRQALKV